MNPSSLLRAAGLLTILLAHRAAYGQAANLAETARVTASSVFAPQFKPANVTDGKITNDSRWLSARGPVPHTLTLEWQTAQRIGAVQIASGWLTEGAWQGPIRDFAVQYRKGTAWEAVPEGAIVANDKPALSLTLAQPVETDGLRLLIQDPGIVRVAEVRVYAPAPGYPELKLPVAAAAPTVVAEIPPLFVNQSGYDTTAPKRCTAPTLPDGTPFAVRRADKTGAALFQGKISGHIGDFSAFRPAESEAEYVVEAGGLRSDPFRVAPLWLERVCLEPALRFMVDARSVAGTHASAYGGCPWRDGTFYSYEVPSLVMLYLAAPDAFEQAPVEISYAQDKARLMAPDFKLVPAANDKGALEAVRRYYAELDPPVGEHVPDIFQLIHWGIGWYLMKPQSSDPSGGVAGNRVQPQTVEQFAFFLYGYPRYRQYFSDGFYRRAHDFAFEQWAKTGLFEVITTVGDFKGRDAPGHSILPNLLMHGVAKREQRADADKYLDAAVRQAKWLVETLDPADPKVTKGQRMSEHMTITGLTTLLRDYPSQAPAGVQPWLQKWAGTMIARSDNLWDFRRYDDQNWTLPRFTPGSHGGAGWNEPGNVAAFPACALSVADLLGDPKQAARLGENAAAHWDDLFGRNPLGAHAAAHGPQDFTGVERGWPKKFPNNTCARLELVRGTINSTAASEHYPFNPKGDFRHPEGWTAFNSALNVGLAYAIRDATQLKATAPRPGEIEIELVTPIAPPTRVAETANVQVTLPGGSTKTVALRRADAADTRFQGTLRVATPGQVTVSYGYDLFRHEQRLAM